MNRSFHRCRQIGLIKGLKNDADSKIIIVRARIIRMVNLILTLWRKDIQERGIVAKNMWFEVSKFSELARGGVN
jgi:hypothetical protein